MFIVEGSQGSSTGNLASPPPPPPPLPASQPQLQVHVKCRNHNSGSDVDRPCPLDATSFPAGVLAPEAPTAYAKAKEVWEQYGPETDVCGLIRQGQTKLKEYNDGGNPDLHWNKHGFALVDNGNRLQQNIQNFLGQDENPQNCQDYFGLESTVHESTVRESTLHFKEFITSQIKSFLSKQVGDAIAPDQFKIFAYNPVCRDSQALDPLYNVINDVHLDGFSCFSQEEEDENLIMVVGAWTPLEEQDYVRDHPLAFVPGQPKFGDADVNKIGDAAILKDNTNINMVYQPKQTSSQTWILNHGMRTSSRHWQHGVAHGSPNLEEIDGTRCRRRSVDFTYSVQIDDPVVLATWYRQHIR